MNTAQILRGIMELSNAAEKYMLILSVVGFAVALLNCFMGYKLRKLWGCILGLVIGAAGGAGAGYYFLKDVRYAAAIGLGAALLLMILAWVFYKLGLFLLCIGLTYGVLWSMFPTQEQKTQIIFLIVGVFLATVAVGYERNVIIVVTGIGGGINAVRLLFSMTKIESNGAMWILAIILAVGGICVQMFPYRDELFEKKEKEQDKDDKKRGRQPAKRRKKKKNLLPKKKKKESLLSKFTKDDRKDSSKQRSQKRTIWEEDEEYSKEPWDEKREPEPEVPKYETFENNSRMTQDILDLDELSRDLSGEIQKIYEEEQKNKM